MRERGAAVHEAVLRSAIRLLTAPDVTVDQLTIARIAAEADVNPSSIYRRWGTRESLFSDAIDRLLAGEQPIRSEGDLEADLISFAIRLQAFLDTPAGRVLSYLSTVPDRGDDDANRRQFWSLRYEQVGEMIDAARRRGEIPESVSTALLLSAVTAPIHLAAVTHHSLPAVSPVSIVQLVLDGARNSGHPRDNV